MRYFYGFCGIMYGLLSLTIFLMLVILALILPTLAGFAILDTATLFLGTQRVGAFTFFALGGPIASIVAAYFLLRSFKTAFSTPEHGTQVDPRIVTLVRKVSGLVGVSPFQGIIFKRTLDISTFYTARGRYLNLSVLALKYLTANELEAIIAHEYAHHHHNAMLVNRVAYRTRLMFDSYCNALSSATSSMARAREKHSSFAMVFNAVGISLFGTYPCMLIFLAFLYLMEIVIRNPTYEYYCDSVAVKFAGGNIFASALEKWTDLLLADESVKSRDTGALRPISETMTNGDEHAEFSTAELTRSAQLEGHWPEAYVERLNSEYCRLRYFDPPLRRAAVQKKTRNHPSVSDRIAKTAQAERRVDSSEPLFSDLDVELWWPKAES